MSPSCPIPALECDARKAAAIAWADSEATAPAEMEWMPLAGATRAASGFSEGGWSSLIAGILVILIPGLFGHCRNRGTVEEGF